MGLYIKDVSMPERCWDCPCRRKYGFCQVTGKYYGVGVVRPDWCPLVEIKPPHGRLIDADEMQEYISLGGLNPDNVSTVIERED